MSAAPTAETRLTSVRSSPGCFFACTSSPAQLAVMKRETAMPAISVAEIAAPAVMTMPVVASAAAAPKRRVSGSRSATRPMAAVTKGSAA